MSVRDFTWSASDTMRVVVDRLNTFAREVAAAINEEGAALSVRGVAGNVQAARVDILASTPSMPLRVADDGLSLGFGQLSSGAIAPGAVGLDQLAPTPVRRVFRSTSQAFPSGALTPVSFSATNIQTGGGNSPSWTIGSPSQVVIRRAGVYRVTGRIGFSAVAVGGWCNCSLILNGAEVCAATLTVVNGVETNGGTSDVFALAAGDVVGLSAYVIATGGLTSATGVHTRPTLVVEYLGGL